MCSIIRLDFRFQNNPKNLDPSYKTDLDIFDSSGMKHPSDRISAD